MHFFYFPFMLELRWCRCELHIQKLYFRCFSGNDNFFLPFTPAPSYTADKDGQIILVNSLDESRVGKCFKEKRVNSNTDNDSPSNSR